MLLVWVLFGMFLPLGVAPREAATPSKEIIRPYDLYDPRFCWLTPRPFLCEKCLRQDRQFVQVLTFSEEGVPVRSYRCLEWNRKYLR